MSAYARLARGLDDEQLGLLDSIEESVRDDERRRIAAGIEALRVPHDYSATPARHIARAHNEALDGAMSIVWFGNGKDDA